MAIKAPRKARRSPEQIRQRKAYLDFYCRLKAIDPKAAYYLTHGAKKLSSFWCDELGEY